MPRYLAIAAFLLASCAPEPVAPKHYDPATCVAACDNAAKLCGPATLKPKSGTCESVCQVTEENGGSFNTGCLAAQATCGGIEACSR